MARDGTVSVDDCMYVVHDLRQYKMKYKPEKNVHFLIETFIGEILMKSMIFLYLSLHEMIIIIIEFFF